MWNLSEASDEQRQVMVDAFTAEQKAYADAGEKERAAAVQESIDLWANPSRQQRERAAAALAATPARSVEAGFSLPEALRK